MHFILVDSHLKPLTLEALCDFFGRTQHTLAYASISAAIETFRPLGKGCVCQLAIVQGGLLALSEPEKVFYHR